MGILWNYLLGYVIIEIKGSGLERFLNHAVVNGVELWNVKRTGQNSICAYTGVSDFYALRKLIRGRGLRINVLNKRGLPISLARFRFRKVLLFGWIIALTLIIAATRCVWVVRVVGCDRVEESVLLEALDGMGVRAGVPKRYVEASSIGPAIMHGDGRIAWAGAELEGVVLTLTVYEADEPGLPVEYGDTPASVYAARDGEIISVVADNGLAAVRPGDVVVKGQVLITGDLSTQEREGPYVSARGSVIARTVYVFEAELGPQAAELTRTGGYTDAVRVSIGEWELPVEATEPEGQYECELISRRLIRNCFLPVSAELVRLHELEPKVMSVPYKRLAELARLKAEADMLSGIPKDAVMLAKSTQMTRLDNGAVRVTIAVTVREDIGEVG